MSTSPVYLHILWHQHQPWYFKPDSRTALMPWVRLHGVKDYYDIAWLSREFDGWKQTVNLVPSLLEQLVLYTDREATDTYWDLSRRPADRLTPDEKCQALEFFFQANHRRMIQPYPRYEELYQKKVKNLNQALKQFTTQDFRDLQVWYNLAWIDPIWHNDPNGPLRALIEKQRDFSEEDKQAVLVTQEEILRRIIPLHRELQQEGKMEITCTPYFHPILPLLCDNSIARISNPYDPVPQPPFAFPEDAEAQIRLGLDQFETIMGFRPQGMWPSEGSVSDQALRLMAQAGIRFAATDENILFRSRTLQGHSPQDRSELYRLHRMDTGGGDLNLVFRDHGLSDLIGFVYQNKDAKEAAADFLQHLRSIGKNWTGQNPPLVSVILDGENCWEFYPNDGHDFLRHMIEGVLKDPQILPTTVPEYAARYPAEPTLQSIYPGSWINNNFRIWIGHQEDNAAWHFLRLAREILVRVQDRLEAGTREAAWKEFYICEGSDWFWWYGDDNFTELDWLFDLLFRDHLSHLYQLIGEPVPEALRRPIKQPRRLKEAGGGILFCHPTITGQTDGYYEWVGSKTLSVGSEGGAMHLAFDVKADVRYGRYDGHLCFSIQFQDAAVLPRVEKVFLHVTKPVVNTLELTGSENGIHIRRLDSQLEAIVPLSRLEVEPHQELWFFLHFESEDSSGFSIPTGNELYLQGYTKANASLYWFL